jgi:ubiquinone/menaquinone biosynthesis C-methylase UbiE
MRKRGPYRHEWKIVSTIIAEEEGYHALDIGTGFGLYAEMLGRVYKEVIAMDLSKEWLLYTKAKRDNISPVLADAHYLPFRSGFFDTVTCIEVLVHLPNPVKALEEIRRVTKSHGRVILSFNLLPTRHDIQKWVETSKQRIHVIETGQDYIVEYSKELKAGLLIRCFTYGQVKAILDRLKLSVIKVFGLGPTKPQFLLRLPFLSAAYRYVFRRVIGKYQLFAFIAHWIVILAIKS